MSARAATALAGWALAGAVLASFGAVPWGDDWVYAWSVENLLATGRLEVLDFSSNLIYAQTVWGALFCLPFGFSFTALRIATWTLGGIALAGVYRLLVDSGADRDAAALGVASVAAFPLFLILSWSFNTDVPLVAAEVWTIVFFQRAWGQRSIRALWTGTLLALLAAAIRIVGLVPALAMSAALLLDRRGWGRGRGRFLIPLSAVVVAAGLTWYHQRHLRHVADLTYIDNTPPARLVALREYGLTLLPTWLPLSVEFIAIGLGLALLPVAFAIRRTPGDGMRAILLLLASTAIVLIGHVISGEHYLGFRNEGARLSDELGSVLTLMPGWRPGSPPTGVIAAPTVLYWGSFLVLGASALRPGRFERAAVCWWTLAGLLVMTAILWIAADRYILAFLPVAIVPVLAFDTRVSWRRGAAAVAVFLVIGVAVMRDRLGAERAVWAAVDDLRAAGVAASDIDAGYVVNGWLQYAHPEQANRDAAGQVAVPFVNSAAELPWIVAAADLPGTERVREYRFARTFREPGSVLVLRRRRD